MNKNNKIDPVSFNAAYPISSILVYPKGTVVVERECLLQGDPIPPKRGKITVLSSKSRARLALTVAECEYELVSMITLTYAPLLPQTGKEAKRHLDTFLRRMRSYFGGFQYVWFMEFSKRGGLHFHILNTLSAGNDWDRKCMSSIWVEVRGLEDWEYSSLNTKKKHELDMAVWNVHKHKKAWEMVRKTDGAARYALKYALKADQKTVPEMYRDIGRFWGCSQAVRKVKPVKVKMSEEKLRLLLSRHCERLEDWEILPQIIFNCFT